MGSRFATAVEAHALLIDGTVRVVPLLPCGARAVVTRDLWLEHYIPRFWPLQPFRKREHGVVRSITFRRGGEVVGEFDFAHRSLDVLAREPGRGRLVFDESGVRFAGEGTDARRGRYGHLVVDESGMARIPVGSLCSSVISLFASDVEVRFLYGDGAVASVAWRACESYVLGPWDPGGRFRDPKQAVPVRGITIAQAPGVVLDRGEVEEAFQDYYRGERALYAVDEAGFRLIERRFGSMSEEREARRRCVARRDPAPVPADEPASGAS